MMQLAISRLHSDQSCYSYWIEPFRGAMQKPPAFGEYPFRLPAPRLKLSAWAAAARENRAALPQPFAAEFLRWIENPLRTQK